MSYPDKCVRGIPNNDEQYVIDKEKPLVGPGLFQFKDTKRSDGMIELSVNWLDDNRAIEIALDQRKENGELQFKAGVVLLSRDKIDEICCRPNIKGYLAYERRPLNNNPYHGNILLRKNINKHTKKQISDTLALMAVIKIIDQDRE